LIQRALRTLPGGLKKLRKNKGLAQKQLAKTLQVSTDYLLSDTDDEAEEIRIQD